MKKIILSFFLFLLIFPFVSCTVILNYLDNKDEIVYENEDKSIRLEIGLGRNYIGKIYINKEGTEYSFPISYCIRKYVFSIYLDPLKTDKSIFCLKANFEKINFFRKNVNIMYLIDDTKGFNNPTNNIFKDFNEKLIRNRKSKVHPLNYINNNWCSIENEIEFINNNLEDFYYGRIKGMLAEEKVFITFNKDRFTIKNNLNEVKLSGKYEFEDLNMILMPCDCYDTYPKKIILKFEKL